MPYVFGRYVLLDSDGDYNCEICKRWFCSEQAILAHCRNTTNHEWCEKCQLVFKTEDAEEEHLSSSSSSHNICFMCTKRPDFTSVEELNEHYNASHFLCGSCQVYYRTKNTLQHHQMKVHEGKKFECPACDRTFSRQSHVLVHLERSSCSSVSKINSLAKAFGCHDHCNFLSDYLTFSCECCEGTFDNLSGLFQHVEDTPDCSDLLQGHGSTLKSRAEYIFAHVK